MNPMAEHAPVYILQLFITGASPRSSRAIANIKKILEEKLQGCYELSVVDLYQQPGMAHDNDIVALPTLVKRLPLPLKKIIGDLSDRPTLVAALGLIERDPGEGPPRR